MKMIRWKLLDNSFVFLKVKKRKERKKKYTNEYQKELIGTLFLYLNFNKDIFFFERPFLPTFFGSYRNHACLYNKKKKKKRE